MHQIRIEDDFDEHFGATLRQLREQKQWSQRQFADELERVGLKLDPSAITRIERGSREVKFREAAIMAHALGVDVNQLLRRGEKPETRVVSRYFIALQRQAMARDELAEMATQLMYVAQTIDLHPEAAQRLKFNERNPTSGKEFLQLLIDHHTRAPLLGVAVDQEIVDLLAQIVAKATSNLIIRREGLQKHIVHRYPPQFDLDDLVEKIKDAVPDEDKHLFDDSDA